ncbi:MAG: hypothetical protein WBW71_10510 [Bacteroidota bacterium]
MTDIPRNDTTWELYLYKLSVYAALGCAALFVCLVALHFAYTPDDAYIYFQYAKNIAHGKGFSFNDSTPSYGTTGPLWALFTAVGVRIGFTPYSVAKSSDFIFAFLSIAGMQFLALEVLHNKAYAFLATAFFSLDAWFIRWSSSGMESSLAVFLSVAAVWLILRNRPMISSFAFACLTLTRPEGGILFTIMYAKFFLDRSSRKRTIADRLAPLFCYGIIILSWLIFSYFHFGKIIPNTYYGKSTGLPSGSEIFPSVSVIIKLLAATQFPLILVCIASFFFRGGRSGWEGKHFLLIWVVMLPVFYILDGVQVVSRYLLIILPFLIICGVNGIQIFFHALHLSSKRFFHVVFTLMLVTFAQNQVLYWWMMKPHLDNFVTGMNNCLKPMGLWLRDNTGGNASVFVPDVGAIGYYSDRVICDIGLITPEYGKAFHGLDYDTGMLQKKYEAIIHPDYVIDRSSIPERLASSSLLPIMTRQFPGLGIANDEMMYYTLYKSLK